jgi:protein-disulfide isomerase
MALRPPASERDHIQGNKNALIELVEYGDYQCPYCGKAYPIIKTLQQRFGKDLKFVFRNFPLSKIHPHAKLAAIAAEAADRQGKFWEMHDLLFENQESLFPSTLTAYAQKTGLDLIHFEEDLQSPDLALKVESDFESGMRSGVNGTPGLFINGEKYNDSWELEYFSAYIKNKIDHIKQDRKLLS